ncbi:MAG: AAA family ATPase [Phycisphaeraceae bacterium]|nr:AAA family ATPase [Phycisphaeraceae bacterium]
MIQQAQQAVTIQNVGPIEQLKITCPPDGGVVVLRGRNGSGKSTALKSAESLAGSKGKLSSRDESRQSGHVQGFGVRLNIGNKTTRAGEIEVASLEGKLNIADLVEPLLKDPAAADRQRIKALVSLTGDAPTCAQFASVIGDDMADFIGGATWSSKDTLEVAVKAKRDLEGAARLKENEANLREGQAKGLEESAKDIDMSGESDEQVLREAHMQASGNMRVLRERQDAAVQSAGNLAKARIALHDVKTAYTGPTVDEATQEVLAKDRSVGFSVSIVSQLEKELAKLEKELAEARANAKHCDIQRDAAKTTLKAAEEYTEAVAMYEAVLEGTATKAPDQSELDVAQQALDEASIALETGAIIRMAQAKLAEAESVRKIANDAAIIADRLRLAAAQIDDVLSAAIKTPQLFVRDGRLYTMHATRGEMLFHELSEGERWTLAFEIAAPIVGERGIMILPQGAWESLDPDNRRHVASLAIHYKIIVLTAEATSDELRAELFEGQVA